MSDCNANKMCFRVDNQRSLQGKTFLVSATNANCLKNPSKSHQNV